MSGARAVAKKNANNEAAASRNSKNTYTAAKTIQESQTGILNERLSIQRKENACSCGGGCPKCLRKSGIQAKLTIGVSDDKYEKEADQVADQVMRMPDPLLQRQPEEEEEGTLQTKPISGQITPVIRRQPEKEEDELQAKSKTGERRVIKPNIESRINNLKGGGQPLDSSTRAFFEPRFGHDFSQVKVHTGSLAAGVAKSINARAFTLGENVVMSSGEFHPNSRAGQWLLAHELTHVIQQGEGRASSKAQNRESIESASIGAIGQGKSSPVSVSTKRSFAHELKQGLQQGKRQLSLDTTSNIQKKDAISSEATKVEVSNDLYTVENWESINQMGIVYQETGAYVRNKPLPGSLGSVVTKKLNQNDKVFILRHNAKDKWYAVTTSDGFVGYIADWLIWKNLPEPNVKILKIPSGNTAIGIAKKFYGKTFDKWGSDQRFVVNALAYANDRSDHNGIGRPGIYKPKGNDQNWAKTKVSKDVYIWLPSDSFLNSLHEKVSSGSISYELWEGVKAIATALAFGAAFIGGILHGAFDGLVALIKGIIDLIWGALKSIFTGNVWNDLKSIWAAITSMGLDDWKDLFFGWMDPWLVNTKSNNPFKAGHAYGYIAGRILFEIVIMFVGGTAIAKVVSKLGKLGSKLSKLGIVQKVNIGLSKASGKVKQGIDKLRALVKPSKGTQVIYNINAKLREKILWGVNTSGNKVIGGHFRGLLGHPKYATEIIGKSVLNPHCDIVKFTKGLPGNRLGRLKKSTLFPRGWSKGDIIRAVEKVANNPVLKNTDPLNPARLFLQGKVKGTFVQVIIENGKITSAFPL